MNRENHKQLVLSRPGQPEGFCLRGSERGARAMSQEPGDGPDAVVRQEDLDRLMTQVQHELSGRLRDFRLKRQGQGVAGVEVTVGPVAPVRENQPCPEKIFRLFAIGNRQDEIAGAYPVELSQGQAGIRDMFQYLESRHGFESLAWKR